MTVAVDHLTRLGLSGVPAGGGMLAASLPGAAIRSAVERPKSADGAGRQRLVQPLVELGPVEPTIGGVRHLDGRSRSRRTPEARMS